MNTDTQLTFTAGAALPSQPPEELVVLPEPFRFAPEGTTFDPPLALTFTYQQESMPEGGIEELTLGFYYIDAQGVVEEAAVLSRDLASNSLTVALPHFSFGFFARLGIALVSAGYHYPASDHRTHQQPHRT